MSDSSLEKHEAQGKEVLPRTVSNAERFGYKQELKTNLSMMTVMGLSFAIIAAPNSLAVTMSFGLTSGVGPEIFFGWLLLSCISLCIAASLGELSSVYPTSGGIYFWAVRTAPKGWGPIVGYVTGWLNLTGNWLIALSIIFSGAQFVMSTPNLWDPNFIAQPYQIWLVFIFFMLICGAINLSKNRVLDYLNNAVMWWTAVAVLVILVTVLVMAKGGRRSAHFVFAEFTPYGGYTKGWSFFIGLLQPGYVITGYGMIASLAEECRKPETEIARAMTLSVFLAGVTGIFFIIPILFVLPNVPDLLTIATGQPMPAILQSATGSAGGAFGLCFLLFGSMFFSATGSITAGARTVYAFSRDGAVPGSNHWNKISPRFEQPVNAIILTLVVNSLLGLIYLGSAAAFNAFTGCGTMALTAAYNAPILMNLISRRKHTQGAIWSLGKWGWPINLVCVLWLPLACVIYSSPIAVNPTPSSMNYSSVIFCSFGLTAVGWYLYWGRKHFKGPALDSVVAVRRAGFMLDTDEVVSHPTEGGLEILETRESRNA